MSESRRGLSRDSAPFVDLSLPRSQTLPSTSQPDGREHEYPRLEVFTIIPRPFCHSGSCHTHNSSSCQPRDPVQRRHRGLEGLIRRSLCLGRASKQPLWPRVQETRRPEIQEIQEQTSSLSDFRLPDSWPFARQQGCAVPLSQLSFCLLQASLFQHKAAVCDMPPSLRPKPSHLGHSKPRLVWHGPGTSCPLLTASERVLRHYGSGFQYVLQYLPIPRLSLHSAVNVTKSQHQNMQHCVIAAQANSLLQQPRIWHLSRRQRMREMFLLIMTIPTPQAEPE